jgi:hypothetical protein
MHGARHENPEATMKPSTLIVSTPFLALALLACGGAQKSAPAAAEAPAAAPAEAPKPAEPAKSGAPTKLGPNQTPDGVVFNFKPGMKPDRLYLAGNFNNWNPADAKFVVKDEDGDGIYSITVKLQPGTYQYKFVADGKWIKDPDSPEAAPDGFGGQNGKFDVK